MAEQSLTDEWTGWMQQPENRAGLVQFGLQMMQPVDFGQNALGHAAQAFGSGAEARDRSITAENTESANAAKAALEERKVMAGEVRAQASKTRAAKSGGVGLSSLISNQRKDRKNFLTWLNEQPEFLSSEDVDAAINDPVQRASLVERYKSQQQLSAEATGTTLQGSVKGPAPASAPQYREGQTATNAATGERRVFRNGQWVTQ